MRMTGMIGGAFAAAMLVAAMPAAAQMKHDATGGTADHGGMNHGSGTMSGDMKGGGMKGAGHAMSEADKTKLASCSAMAPAMAMKDARCVTLMKAHSDSMSHKKSM